MLQVLVETDAEPALTQDARERCLADLQRFPAQVSTVQLQQVEGVEERLGPLSGLVVHLCGGCGYVEPRNASPIPQDAPLPGRRSPPPQNETTDTGQVDRYQREQAYDGTQMVCDDRAFAYRLVHRLTQRRALRKQG